MDDKSHPANAEGIAFNNGASCSRKGTRQSDGWTSSEDEAEAMEQTDEGNVRSSCSVSKF